MTTLRFYRKSKLMLAIQFLSVAVPVSVLYLLTMMILPTFFLEGDDIEDLNRWMTIIYRGGCVLVALEMVRRFYDEQLAVGKRRVVQSIGLVSFGLRKISIAFRDVRDVRVQQSLFGRFFDYGSLQLGTPSTFHYEIVFDGLSEPYKLAREIEDRCARARGQSNGNIPVAHFLQDEDNKAPDDDHNLITPNSDDAHQLRAH